MVGLTHHHPLPERCCALLRVIVGADRIKVGKETVCSVDDVPLGYDDSSYVRYKSPSVV
jgi:hypothetical protein